MRTALDLVMCGLILGAIAPLLASEPAPPPPPVEEKLSPPPPAEYLAKIIAPAAKPVIKTKQGYTVEVDRTKQVLGVDSPKKDIWISPQVEGRQTVEVVMADAPLQKQTTVLARLKKGRILYANEERGEWVSTSILDKGSVITGWVQKKHLKPVGEDYPPERTLSSFSNDFASAAMLIQKAKQFDDGLYAAVELAMQDGLGPVTGKRDWLPRLANKVYTDKEGSRIAELFFAAAELGGVQTASPAALQPSIAKVRREFLADEKRSKPLGFYTWSTQLENIFRQDRLLQTKVETGKQDSQIIAVARALKADAETRQSYEAALQLNERLTNKLTSPGYRPLLAALDAGKAPELAGVDFVSFLPASRSHEADLVMKLYGDKPIPPGFDLMQEVIARLKRGVLSFEPQDDSGWYDHQLWSLEPLVRFDSAAEAKKLRPNAEYLKHLEELFKGTYALMRETHVKQLEIPAPASEAPGPPVKEREKVFIQPDPHVELLPTMCLRRAQSYRFVRGVLEETFGRENIAKLQRQTAAGPVKMNLAEELDQMERLFQGAYVVACRELGLPDELPAGQRAGQSTDDLALVYLRWLASVRSDADLAADARMMVPVFFDQQRRQLKVWLLIGWESSSCSYHYAQNPAVTITGPNGKPAAGEEAPEIIFTGSYRSLATPVFAEVYVNKLLDRTEFRRHCDTYRSQAAIVANLE